MDKSNSFNNDRFRVWISQANHDLFAAKKTFDFASYEWSCYQSIQAVEKAFKSLIVHSGFRPPKTHKLGVLLSMCNRANKDFASIKFNFRRIEGFTFISRYPFIIPGQNITPHDLITKDDAITCIKIAEDIIEKVTQFLENKKVSQDKQVSLYSYYYSDEEVEKRKESIISIAKDSKIKDFKVEKIYLFGGFAREKIRPRTSTMDIIVIADTKLSFIERIQAFRDCTKGMEPIVEPLVYTPEEFKFMIEEEGEGFLESALEESIVLYDVSQTAPQV